ncbi:hypothetical protein [Moorena sp. SIO4A5]|uniref:hypothetical protein n=1 Tax=Moorena sp. SIO4A5 TaxID=2607838 RepID=UPI0013C73A14|nr:hypothetical protein [Moorena sp. SIO4A5]NEO23588.1 hypothetical protein [Moorena sp. SIO4A5]
MTFITIDEAIDLLSTGQGISHDQAKEAVSDICKQHGINPEDNKIDYNLVVSASKGFTAVDKGINKAIASSKSAESKGGALSTQERKDEAMVFVQEELHLAGIDNFPVQIMATRIDNAIMDGIQDADATDYARRQAFLQRTRDNNTRFYNEVLEVEQQSREEAKEVADAITQQGIQYHFQPVESNVSHYTSVLKQRRLSQRTAQQNQASLVQKAAEDRKTSQAIAKATSFLDDLEAEVEAELGQ